MKNDLKELLINCIDNLYERHGAGGPLHIITDDNNCRNSDLDFCLMHLNDHDDITDFDNFVCRSILALLYSNIRKEYRKVEKDERS